MTKPGRPKAEKVPWGHLTQWPSEASGDFTAPAGKQGAVESPSLIP
ncbi:hypothetical protein [Candidatus Methylomirabilis sp.]